MSKSQKADEYKNALAILDTNFSTEVNSAYQVAKAQLDNVQTANLEGPARAMPDDLRSQLETLNATFMQQIPQKRAQLQPQRETAERNHTVFLIVQIALIVVGVLMLLGSAGAQSGGLAGFGIVLIIVGIVCHYVFKSMSAKSVEGLALDWHAFFEYYAENIGHPESLHTQATGLYKGIDQLYLQSLTEQARGFEMQQRQMKKQMEAQNEQSQQQLAMQMQTMQAMQQGMQQISRQQTIGNIINLSK